ncbi:MAG: ABC transporter family substrate-binding protein [Acidimicrobiales bacterium]
MIVLLSAAAALSAGAVPASSATTTSSASPLNPWVAGLGGTLTLGIDQAPTGCNPNARNGDTVADRLVLAPVLPSAFVTSSGDQPVYDSAVINQAEVVSPSPLTVVYTLNPHAVWSDGTPITAADFVYAWQQQRGPVATPFGFEEAGSTAAATSLGYRDIRSVTGSNRGRTVTVVFSTPFADWKMLFHDLLPVSVLQRTGWDPACRSVDPAIDLSGGPFELSSVTADQIVLTRNPRWWGQTPDLARIVVRIARDATELARWVTTGKVQVVQPSWFGTSFLASVSDHPAVSSAEEISAVFLQLEFATATGPTADLRLRQAVAHAIDRQSLVTQLVGPIDTEITPAASHLYSQGQPAYPGPVPAPVQVAGQPTYHPPPPPTTPTAAMPYPLVAQPSETTSLLAQIGYVPDPQGVWGQPDGKPLVLRLVVDAGDEWASATAAVIVHQLTAAGLDVATTSEPTAQATGSALANGQADMALLPMTATPYPSEALAWYTPLLGPPGQYGSADWSNYDDPTLNTLLTKASRELSPVTASPMYAQADLMLWKAMVALPLFAEPEAMAWSSDTTGEGLSVDRADLLWSPGVWANRVPPTSPMTAAN